MYNYKKKGTPIKILVSKNSDIKLWLVNENTTELDYEITDGDDYDIVNIDPINDDGIVIYKSLDKVIFIRVGDPPIMLLTYKPKSTRYKYYDSNMELIDEGDLVEIVEDIYGVSINYINESYMVIDDKKVTAMIPSILLSNDTLQDGKILLNNNSWQLIAIPVRDVNVKDYFIDEIDRIIKTYDDTKSVDDVIVRVSSCPGHLDNFLTYVVGKTPYSNQGNFDLVMEDNNVQEITAFWVKVKDYKKITKEDIVYEWRNYRNS